MQNAQGKLVRGSRGGPTLALFASVALALGVAGPAAAQNAPAAAPNAPAAGGAGDAVNPAAANANAAGGMNIDRERPFGDLDVAGAGNTVADFRTFAEGLTGAQVIELASRCRIIDPRMPAAEEAAAAAGGAANAGGPAGPVAGPGAAPAAAAAVADAAQAAAAGGGGDAAADVAFDEGTVNVCRSFQALIDIPAWVGQNRQPFAADNPFGGLDVANAGADPEAVRTFAAGLPGAQAIDLLGRCSAISPVGDRADDEDAAAGAAGGATPGGAGGPAAGAAGGAVAAAPEAGVGGAGLAPGVRRYGEAAVTLCANLNTTIYGQTAEAN